jgi:hypothetical protein
VFETVENIGFNQFVQNKNGSSRLKVVGKGFTKALNGEMVSS